MSLLVENNEFKAAPVQITWMGAAFFLNQSHCVSVKCQLTVIL